MSHARFFLERNPSVDDLPGFARAAPLCYQVRCYVMRRDVGELYFEMGRRATRLCLAAGGKFSCLSAAAHGQALDSARNSPLARLSPQCAGNLANRNRISMRIAFPDRAEAREVAEYRWVFCTKGPCRSKPRLACQDAPRIGLLEAPGYSRRRRLVLNPPAPLSHFPKKIRYHKRNE